jgi:hypothetical protein
MPAAQPPPPAPGAGSLASGPARVRSPLAQLNADIAARAAASPAHHLGSSAAAPWPELRSARRFREAWERLGAEDAVDQASQRAPDQAGPLNSHMLVLRTLGLMRELSPHYLRRFLSHTETLLWLDQLQALPKTPARKAGSAKK